MDFMMKSRFQLREEHEKAWLVLAAGCIGICWINFLRA
jgi:hypothetical protein